MGISAVEKYLGMLQKLTSTFSLFSDFLLSGVALAHEWMGLGLVAAKLLELWKSLLAEWAFVTGGLGLCLLLRLRFFGLRTKAHFKVLQISQH